MKKIFNYSILLLCTLVMGLTGCKKEELVFDYEKLHFETKADAILLEVTVPSGTGEKDDIYVVGAFNDNKVNAEFKLTKHPETGYKFGIYLYEEDFVEGYTLADGFHFVNATLGAEVYDKEHVIANAVAGQRYEISFSRWNTTEKPIVPGEFEHLYVLGNVDGTDWDPAAPLELEMVGTDIFRAELSFPNETNWFAFCTEYGTWDIVNAARWGAGGAELTEGAPLDIVCDGTEQTVTIPGGKYVITVNMVKKIAYLGEEEPVVGEKFPTFEHDGDAIYICNMAGWDEVALYAWHETEPELFGGWPGAQPKEKFTFKGYDWYFFDCGAENAGLFYHFIANNNNNGKQVEPLCEYELTTDGIKYIIIKTDLSKEEIEDPENYDFGDGPAPKPDEKTSLTVFLYDATETMNYCLNAETEPVEVEKFMYSWGSPNNILGEWPGTAFSEFAVDEWLGLKLLSFEIECEVGDSFNFILNNKGPHDEGVEEGVQYDAFKVDITEEDMVVYYKLTDSAASPLELMAKMPKR